MNGFQVEKERLAVRLLLSDGQTADGFVHVASCSPLHSGVQSLPELMAEVSFFLPFHAADGPFRLIGADGICAVVESGSPSSSPAGLRVQAEVRMEGGHRLRGEIVGEPGVGPRLSDVLALPSVWCRLETPEGRVWVRKARILSLEPEPA